MEVTNEDLPSRRIFRRNGGALRHSDPLDLPFQLDARRLLHAPAHRLAQGLDIRGGGAAEIDQEVAVHLRNLGVAVFQAAAAGGINELPRFLAGRILERRAAGAALDRLRLLAIGGDVVHLGENLRGIARLALEQNLGEDEILGRAAPDNVPSCKFAAGGLFLAGPGQLDVTTAAVRTYDAFLYVNNKMVDPSKANDQTIASSKSWRALAAKIRVNPSDYLTKFPPAPDLLSFSGDNRLPLDGREPPEGLVTALMREARREGAWLRPVEEGERRAVAELVVEGDELQWSSARFRAELAQWTRPNSTTRKDGMPGYAHGMSDAAAMVHPLLVRFTNPAHEEAERDRRRATCCKALLVLSTPRDGKAEWFVAGEALQRNLLRATARGLFASYFAQPIETPDLRAKLQDVLAEPGVPQVMFRLGYGREVRAVPRRTVDEVLRRESAERTPTNVLALRTPPPASWDRPPVP